MRRFATWAYRRVLGWLQQQCDHPLNIAAADILEGDFRHEQVQWCKICGAYKRRGGEWRDPRADWYASKP